MTTRTQHIMDAAGLSRMEIGLALGCDTSTISRLLGGRRETPPQRLLLDHLARQHGLDHLTADVFSPPGLVDPVSGGAVAVAPCPIPPRAGGGGDCAEVSS